MLKEIIIRKDKIISGTKIGGLKASQTTKEKHGEDFYIVIGSKGGKAKVPKGFAMNKELASRAGRKGGLALKNFKKGGVSNEASYRRAI